MTMIVTCFFSIQALTQHKAGISKSGNQPSTQQEQFDEFWHSAKRIRAGAAC
jgi:hypothetical protein